MKKHKASFLPLISFALGLAAFLLFLLFYNVLGYGNYTILRGDLYVQYVDFIRMFLRVLKGEEDFWYSFSIYLGSGTVLTYAYYAFSPFNLLYLLEFISIPAMTIVIISLKIALSAATFTIFAKKVIKCSDTAAVFFSLCYALNAFSITFHFNIIWLEAVYMLPVVILLIFSLFDEGKFLGLVPAWAFMFLTNFYMAYICGIFTALVFFFLLIARRPSFKKGLGLFFRFAAGVTLAAGCCAALLLPCASFLISHMAADNFEFTPLPTSIFDIINSLFIGSMPDIDNRTPLIYCSIPVLLLIPFYFTSKKIRPVEKILTALLLLIYSLAMVFLPLFIFMHAFDYPNFYFFRYSFCVSFVLCCLACRSIVFESTASRKKALWIYIAGLVCFYSFMIAFGPLNSRASDSTNSKALLALNIVFLFFWGSALCIKDRAMNKKPARYIFTVTAFIVLIAELALNGKISMDHTGLLPISEDEYNNWYKAQSSALTAIPENDKDFYRVSMYGDNNYNSPCFYGYAGFNTFSSSDDYNMRQALYSLGISGSNRSITENGYTDITHMLLGAGYTADINTLDADSEIRHETLTPFPYRLGLAYAVSPSIREYSPVNDPFENQEKLCELMTGKKRSFFERLTLSDIKLSSFNASMYNIGENTIFYKKTDYKNTAGIYFTRPLSTGKRFMVCFRQNISSADATAPYILCGNDCFAVTSTLSDGCIFTGGPQNGSFGDDTETVVIYFNDTSVHEYPCNSMYFAQYNETELQALYSDLKQNVLKVNEWHGGYINGTISIPEGRNVLFTSIPYDKNWSAYIDGIQVEITPVLNDAFIALDLTSGNHNITLKYDAPGKKGGAVISILSLILFILLSVYFQGTRKRSLNKHKTDPN